MRLFILWSLIHGSCENFDIKHVPYVIEYYSMMTNLITLAI